MQRCLGAMVYAVACIALAACSTRVNTVSTTPAAQQVLPRPDMVVVDDFAVDPGLVQVDPGLGGRLRRQLHGTDVSSAQAHDADTVRLAISDTLVKAIQAMGLPAQLATGERPGGNVVLVQGNILSINEGNRTRRTVVGFGAGQSSVQAAAQILYDRPGTPPQLLQSYDADANSGRMPGLAAGAASSAASGSAAAVAASAGLHVTTGNRADVGAEAQRLAQRMATNIGTFFAQQGWIPASAVPSPRLR